MSNYQRAIYKILHERPVAYNPGLAKTFGSVKAAIFIGQLLYWQGKGRKGEWTYKTVEDFKEETGLSRTEQESAIKLSKRLGILELKRKGIPPIRHFKLNIEKIIDCIAKTQSHKSCESINVKRLNKIGDEGPYNPDSTPNKTSYSKIKNINKFIEEGRKSLSDSMSIK